ncbi:MAG TPA: ABC transporter permease [Terracidiphilus sp.]|jgi:putative ABC transport system permease protein
MSRIVSSVRIASRRLWQVPGFTLTVLLTLALGIGATTAIFSLIEGILLRPLPFHDPDGLVDLGDRLGESPGLPVTAREIGTYSSTAMAFSGMGAERTVDFELSGDATPSLLHGARMTASIFPTLGVAPLLGRVFTSQEDAGRAPVAVLSYGLWEKRYGRDPHVVGKDITLSRRNYTIVGVMPPGFEFPLAVGRLDEVRVWVPMSLTADDLSDANVATWAYHLVARLKPGITLQQAGQDADRIGQEVMRGFPPSLAAVRIHGEVRPLRNFVQGAAGPLLRTLFLAVSVVLLIACANVAVLLLVRALRRRRAFAVSLALGASVGDILGESLCEGLLLSLTGGVLGLAFAFAVIGMGSSLLPDSLPRADTVSLDPWVALFALLLAVVTGAGCSLVPAWAAIRTNLLEGLRGDARTSTGSAQHGWLRSSLVVGEIAIALILLTVSLAFLRSYQKMLAVDPGFSPEHVLAAGYELPDSQYKTEASAATFNREVVDRLSRQASVSAVGLSNVLPANGRAGEADYTVEGTSLAGWKMRFAPFVETYGDYFRAMGIAVIAGRSFTMRDRADSPLVIIVNQLMARHSWPGENPIGKRVHLGNPHAPLPWATVVGIVADTRMGAPDQPAPDQFYFPVAQPAILTGTGPSEDRPALSSGFIAVRSTLPPEEMIHTLRSVVAGIDPQLALDPVRSMSDALSNVEAPRRFNTRLIGIFTVAALLLAVMGIYAVMAFSVSLRTQEIAIRMALGAQRGSITRLILGSGMRIALVGCALGVIGSLGAIRLVASLLFDVKVTEPWIYVAGVGIMTLLALGASVLPARRAAAADPVRSLRAA